MQKRMTYNFVNTNWTCPAGVTAVMIQAWDSGETTNYLGLTVVTVVPNTTYTYTYVNSMTPGSQNTLGSIFTWGGGTHLGIWWME